MTRRPTEDTDTILDVLAYVDALYDELTGENGAPTLGTQNQMVTFILADPELTRSVLAWAREREPLEARVEPPQRLPQDDAYRRISAEMRRVLQDPVFLRERQRPH